MSEVVELEIDEALIRDHVKVIHDLAAALPAAAMGDLAKGKLVIASFGENPITGKQLPSKIVHVRVGEIDRTIDEIVRLSREPHRNVYMPLAIFRDDLSSVKKGAEADIIAVLGIVADFDDKDARRWGERVPAKPTFVLETSAGRFQAFYAFDKPAAVEAVKPIAERLKAAAQCDHGASDLSHVWRIAGCLNWPNRKKVAEGRTPEPQPVKVAMPWDAAISVAELAEALDQFDADQPDARDDQSTNTSGDSGDEEAASDTQRSLINGLIKQLPQSLCSRITTAPTAATDRSAELYHVIVALYRRGLDAEAIERIIRHYPTGIGEKYVGRDDLDREIARIIAKQPPVRSIGDEWPDMPPLRPVCIDEFLRLELPPREMILDPWLPQKGLAMLHSQRGVGKTLLGVSIGYAVACGGKFLGFSAPKPRRVLYIDGEMPATGMQERLKAIKAGFDQELPDRDFFRILNSDITGRGLPDLATPEGQAEIDAVIDDAELIILDNISTLVRSGKENEAESWLPVQGWALNHRRAGHTVVFIHHAGKGGLQRGTSRREDVLDTVISLGRPQDYRDDQGARFEVRYEKARNLFGDDARMFEARYETQGEVGIWARAEIADAELARVVECLNEGMSIRDTAEETGLSKGKVERLKAKAIKEGKLKADKPRNKPLDD